MSRAWARRERAEAIGSLVAGSRQTNSSLDVARLCAWSNSAIVASAGGRPGSRRTPRLIMALGLDWRTIAAATAGLKSCPVKLLSNELKGAGLDNVPAIATGCVL